MKVVHKHNDTSHRHTDWRCLEKLVIIPCTVDICSVTTCDIYGDYSNKITPTVDCFDVCGQRPLSTLSSSARGRLHRYETVFMYLSSPADGIIRSGPLLVVLAAALLHYPSICTAIHSSKHRLTFEKLHDKCLQEGRLFTISAVMPMSFDMAVYKPIP